MPLSDKEQELMTASADQLKKVMDKAFKETGVKVRQ
jgi:L-lactate dehydrogenase